MVFFFVGDFFVVFVAVFVSAFAVALLFISCCLQMGQVEGNGPRSTIAFFFFFVVVVVVVVVCDAGPQGLQT